MAHKRGFPIFAVILLIFAVAWVLSEIGVIAIDIPWFPVILAVIAIGLIFNRLVYNK